MADQKTKPTEVSVKEFIDKVENEQMRDDSRTLVKLMKKVTGENPKMWGPTIIGFGKYHYKYESGHEGYSCVAGFSPRKGNISVYVMNEGAKHQSLLKKLGKHKMAKACLYIKKLDDVDLDVLEEIVKGSVESVKKKYPDK